MEGYCISKIMITIPGTDCRICYDEEGFPDVVTWMTPVMNKNLVRYGETTFLDAQMRKYNQLNWSYIVIMTKDG